MRITLSGPPGSGKTTVAKLLSSAMNYPLISGGEIFRKMAMVRDMDLVEFSKYAEANPDIDFKVDNEIVRLALNMENVIVDARLGGWMLHKNGIDAFKVYITATPEIRAKRIQQRDGGNFKSVLSAMLIREESERRRYRELYNVNYDNLDIYELVINSDIMLPDEIVHRILDVIGWK